MTVREIGASMRWLAGILLVAGVMRGQGTPQGQAQGQASTLQVESRIVLLDVAVKDAKGMPVLDLRPDEFRITERRVPQVLKSFEPPSVHAMPSGGIVVNSTADLGRIGQAPVTLIVLDELNMTLADRSYMRTKLVEWLRRQPAVLPQPTAVLAVTDREFHVLRDYTQDRGALLAVMQKHTGDVEWRHDSNGSVGSVAQENIMSTLGALEQVTQATRGIPGRKNVIWVGNGFPSMNMVAVGRRLADAVSDALRKVSTQMLKARVTLSVVGGMNDVMPAVTIETDSDKDMADMSGDVGLSLTHGSAMFEALAPPTGGHAFAGRNDLDAEIGEAVDEGGSYYTISYRPTDASHEGKAYRQIRVTVTRPGLTVETRDGYFEEPKAPAGVAQPSMQQLAFDLNGAGMSTLQYTDLHVTVEKVRDGEYTLHASARDMGWQEREDGRRHADLVLLAMCFSDRGRMTQRTFATLGSTTEATLAGIGAASTMLPMKVSIPAGTRRIRFVVRDMGSGRVGTADYNL